MDLTKYEERTVKILDAVIDQQLGTDDDPRFTQSLYLLLKDIERDTVVEVSLDEKEIQRLMGSKDLLTSKQLIDLSILLRQREDPIKLMVPIDATSVSAEELIEMSKIEKSRRKPRKNNYRKSQNKKVV